MNPPPSQPSQLLASSSSQLGKRKNAARTTPASSSSANDESTPSSISCHPRDIAVIVHHYLRKSYPKVVSLFRMEVKSALGGFDCGEVSYTPKSLESILGEFNSFKSRQNASRDLFSSMTNFSRINSFPVVVDQTMKKMIQCMEEYSTWREFAEKEVKQGRGEVTLQQLQQEERKEGGDRPSASRAPTTVSQLTNSSPANASSAASSTLNTSAIATNATDNSAQRSSSPVTKKRRKGSSPKRRIIPTAVPSHSAAAAASSSSSLPPLPPHEFGSSTVDPSGDDAWFFNPIHLPDLGPDTYAQMQVDAQGYENLMAHEEGLPAYLAKVINQAARQGSETIMRGGSGGPTPRPASISPSVSLLAPSTSTAGAPLTHAAALSPAPSLTLSAEVMHAIAEQCLADPTSAKFMDEAFAPFVPDPTADTPNDMAETPNDIGETPNETPNNVAATPQPSTPMELDSTPRRALRSNSGAAAAAARSSPSPSPAAASLPPRASPPSRSPSSTRVPANTSVAAATSTITPVRAPSRSPSTRRSLASAVDQATRSTIPRRTTGTVAAPSQFTQLSSIAAASNAASKPPSSSVPVKPPSSMQVAPSTQQVAVAASASVDADDDLDSALLDALGTVNDSNVDELLASIRQK